MRALDFTRLIWLKLRVKLTRQGKGYFLQLTRRLRAIFLRAAHEWDINKNTDFPRSFPEFPNGPRHWLLSLNFPVAVRKLRLCI